MKPLISIAVSVFFVFYFWNAAAFAKDAPGRYSGYALTVTPHETMNLPEIEEPMFGAAVADTFELAWYQFDGPGGLPDPQGWTAHDLSSQYATYFHVDGSAGAPCNAITPVNGTKSMWCGQWATAQDPWCVWAALPGYGNNWDQSLESTVNAGQVNYVIAWDSESGYDYTYVEWWDAVNEVWVADPTVNGGLGAYDGAGGPVADVSTAAGAGLPATRVRFHFVSDVGGSDEDGSWSTAEGAVKVDDLQLDGGAIEDWENEACTARQSTDGKWIASCPPGFGLYAALHQGWTVVQEDPCVALRSCLWGFFDDPASTNYACGGWPLQGAVPYGPDVNGLYLNNEIWSPWIPIAGIGTQFVLSFLTYRDLDLDDMVFYAWHVRGRDNDTGGCPATWGGSDPVFYGAYKDWIRESFDVGSWVSAADDDIQIALGAVDMSVFWGGEIPCHSHAPLFDQVRLVRVGLFGPLWSIRPIDLWQDNFPEEGGVGPTDYARCDMAMDILPFTRKRICPGDSLKVTVTDPLGFAFDATGGRNVEAIYTFVKVTDRFGNPVAGKNGMTLQSPDVKRHAGDAAGLLRFPWVAGLAPAGWDAYRMDRAYTSSGSRVKDGFCGDLMDLAGPSMPATWHQNENKPANTGIFAPGDVINYILAAKNAQNQWSYWHRTLKGQGAPVRTNTISDAMKSPCEWSVLPDAGRTFGDILFVDDADDCGGPPQLYFDWAFKYLQLTDYTDRYDVLGSSFCGGNSLASRLTSFGHDVQVQLVDRYKYVLWNSSDLSRGLMGDGGVANGGASAEKSDDFYVCYRFLTQNPFTCGWAYWGDDVVQDWATLAGVSALAVKEDFMNHTIALPAGGDQSTVTGVVSPTVNAVPNSPWDKGGPLPPDPELFFVSGSCPAINDFDMPVAQGAAQTGHLYDVPGGPGNPAAPASVYQCNPAFRAAFFLVGFGFDSMRDDVPGPIPDYVPHLRNTLLWFEGFVQQPIGIDPVAFVNRLEDNYPNPFNPTTTIRYSIAERGHVTLRIYNAAGQLVRTLVDEEQAPKPEGFSVTWDGVNNGGSSVASGVYFYQLTAKGFTETKKMVLLK